MAQKNPNPYSNGNYAAIFGEFRRLKIATKAALIAFCQENLQVLDRNKESDTFGQMIPMPESAAKASVGVILSPRETGDANHYGRGNFSAMGHLYFAEPMTRKVINKETGEKEEQRFRLRWRKEVLPPWKREYAHLTLDQQIAKEAEKAEAKAQREAAAAEAAKAKAEREAEREAKRKAKEAEDAKKKAEREKKRKEREAKAAAKANKPKGKRGRPKKKKDEPEAEAPEAPEAETPETDETPTVEIEATTDTVETPEAEVETEDNGELAEA